MPIRNGPDLWGALAPRPGPSSHKYSRGSVIVASGPPLAGGAALLAARAALGAGAGLVTLVGEPAALAAQTAQVAAIMTKPAQGPAAFAARLADPRTGALVLGPGAGVSAATRLRLLRALDAAHVALVLDADALSVISRDPALLAARRRRDQAIVLTPHAGEFARLCPDLSPGPDEAARITAARLAAGRFGAVVVLKGHRSVIAAPDGRIAIDADAGPELATAGSGDVLAGIVASHLAQGMPAFEATAAAVWLHAVTGRTLGAATTGDRLADAVRPLAAAMAASAPARP